LRQRPDALRGKFLRHAIVQRLERRGLERGERWPQRQRGSGKRGAGGGAMQPATAADILRQIVHVQPARGGALDAQTGSEPAAGKGWADCRQSAGGEVTGGEGAGATGTRRVPKRAGTALRAKPPPPIPLLWLPNVSRGPCTPA
jgi:hypothetical protein